HRQEIATRRAADLQNARSLHVRRHQAAQTRCRRQHVRVRGADGVCLIRKGVVTRAERRGLIANGDGHVTSLPGRRATAVGAANVANGAAGRKHDLTEPFFTCRTPTLPYRAMRQMQPVLWTKGVLLSPQHFQTQDRFLEDLLEFQLSTLAFCPWGFRSLEIDREALAAGTFALASAAGIFPDG